MAEVKWIKIVTDVFDDEKMLLIESLPSADSIIVIWFKLLCLAGKNNNSGVFMLNERIAYTDEMLATIFRRDVNTVRLALKTFEMYGMIEVINDVITIPNWSKHQTLDQLEERKEYMKDYMKKYRQKQKALSEGKVNSKVNSKANVNSLEEEVEGEEEVDIDKSNNTISKDIVSSNKLQPIIDKWNSLGLQKLISINPGTTRYKLLNARINEYGEDKVLAAIENIRSSTFLKGQNSKGWTITFDWLVKPNNFLKVIEGNYEDKKTTNNGNKNKLRFDNFKGRDYDYDDLEKKLLGWDKEEEGE
ncbi:phage replisome organizer N-terminal domain-containing protein [Clostridium sp. Sa3CUN1]|uniref:Phage replisome organizer N-terminal domain-containing protein n=1 Tax=Clostridium gallinarum TaxID=2762246 RepID=A0ABR8Q281_9CLOT|nr:phage replisome organizer N-terminal domain-containing protein [Clostridium gallinarum]MBD7914525.1 phage replisome organizer N-terminal domain-containing protein [Clostridium gallinarum]